MICVSLMMQNANFTQFSTTNARPLFLSTYYSYIFFSNCFTKTSKSLG